MGGLTNRPTDKGRGALAKDSKKNLSSHQASQADDSLAISHVFFVSVLPSAPGEQDDEGNVGWGLNEGRMSLNPSLGR